VGRQASVACRPSSVPIYRAQAPLERMRRLNLLGHLDGESAYSFLETRVQARCR
jgi:hypothetical protein